MRSFSNHDHGGPYSSGFVHQPRVPYAPHHPVNRLPHQYPHQYQSWHSNPGIGPLVQRPRAPSRSFHAPHSHGFANGRPSTFHAQSWRPQQPGQFGHRAPGHAPLPPLSVPARPQQVPGNTWLHHRNRSSQPLPRYQQSPRATLHANTISFAPQSPSLNVDKQRRTRRRQGRNCQTPFTSSAAQGHYASTSADNTKNGDMLLAGTTARPRSVSTPAKQHDETSKHTSPDIGASPLSDLPEADALAQVCAATNDSGAPIRPEAKVNLLNSIQFDLEMSLYGLRSRQTFTGSKIRATRHEDANGESSLEDRNHLLQVMHEEINSMTDRNEAAICLNWMHETFYGVGDRLAHIKKFAWLDLYSPVHQELLDAAIDWDTTAVTTITDTVNTPTMAHEQGVESGLRSISI